jgi:uncharacterized repeat protein (TIGR02543 family)
VEDVREAVDEVLESEANILVAMDISFWLDDIEIEPEEPVRVRIAAPELEGKRNLQVIHFPDDAEEPETVELIPEEDLIFALGANEVAFRADSFSVYVVVDDGSEDDNARLEVNFFNLEHDTENPIATVYIKNSDFYLGNGEREQGKSYIDDIVYDPGIGEDYVLGSNMFRGWTIDAADANPQPQPTEEEPNPDPVPYGANYNRNTKVYTVDDITKYLAGRLGSIQEGQVLNIYAMIFQTYTISYYGASTDVSMGMHTVFAPLNENAEAPYKIDMTFTPEDNEHFFEGWMILDGAENIVSATAPDGTVIEGRVPISAADPDADPPVVATVFPDSSNLVVKGDVSFTVSQPAGHWLIFKENGKGATYNAPEFVKNGENTVKPANAENERMIRNGYDFQGWYRIYTKIEDGKVVPDLNADGSYKFYPNEFVFGQPLAEETIIAAKWEAKAKANYVVIFWGQKLDADDKYDFISSQNIEGNVGTAINVTHTTSTISVTGATTFTIPTGFEYASADTGKTVATEGNTVVNVYCNRKQYTLTFTVTASNYISYVYNNRTYSDATIGSQVTDEEALAILDGEDYASYRKEVGGDTIFSFSSNGTTYYYIKNNDKWYPITAEGYYVYNSTQILRFPSSGGTVKTITAKYGEPIADNFPIIGDDGVAYVHGERWKPGSNSLGWSEVMVFIDTMREDNVTFTLDVQQRPLKSMYYYVEALDSDTDTVSWNGGKYVLYTEEPIRARYNGVTAEDFVELKGFTKIAAADANGTVLTPHSVSGANGQYYIFSTSADQDIYFYYSRNKYAINYFDGVYVDGNDNKLTDYASLGQWKKVENVLYESDTTSYNLGGANYYTPQEESRAYPGFVFEGWYIDDTCTTPYTFDTMPYGGLNLYAKWRQVQYRVFLRTNVPFSDKSLSWGSDDQAMNFRISNGGYVSTPTGTRNGYVFVGWYFDDDFDEVFNNEVVPLTTANVTDDYDKTATAYMTDNEQTWTNPTNNKVENKPINKWGILEPNDPGINKDVNRFWITKKLDLYAKWKAILDGAEGISVLYDEVPGEGSGHGQPGSAPGDAGRLYEDNAKSIAQAASKAAAEDEQFLYWVVQKWIKPDAVNNVEGHWEDVLVEGETIKVYPGDNFLVKEEYARITPDPDNAGKNFYEVQLRAVYGSKDAPAPTHITWYSNIYDVAGNQFVDTETNSKMTHPSDATWNEDSGWYVTQDPVEINNAYAIPTPPYSYEGYTFLGWGRVCDPSSVPEGGKAYVTDPSTLTEDDLYIKWVPVEGETNGGHYEAQLPKDKLTRDYYLVGFMNGADNNDGIKIPKSSGKLTITFTQKSYLAVKAPEGNWYKMFNEDFTDPNPTPSSGSANLYDASTNNDQKLPVPAGVQLTITVEELKRDDGSIYGVKLSYTSGSAPSGNIVPGVVRADGEEELEWKTVQYVAADEEKPYHDMYAIWGGEFKVYHSGIEGGAVETYNISRANKELDLTRYYVASRADTDPHAGEYKDSGFLYGG